MWGGLEKAKQFLSRPGMAERGQLLQGAGQAMQGGGLGQLMSGLKAFRNWRGSQRPQPQPQGPGPGSWAPPPDDFGQVSAPKVPGMLGGGGGMRPGLGGRQLQAPQLQAPPRPTSGFKPPALGDDLGFGGAYKNFLG
jgi:hypothetical protein